MHILSLPVTNVKKKINLEGSLPTYKYLHWLAVHHKPLGYKQFNCAGGSYRVISENPLPWKEILIDSWLRVSSWNCFSRYVCYLTGKQHHLIYHLTRTKFPTLFPPFHYQSALAQTYVSLFPWSRVDCFIEKKIFPAVFVETSLWRLWTTPKCHICSFSAATVFPPAFKNLSSLFQLKLFASTWSVNSANYRFSRSISSKFYVSNDVNLYFTIGPSEAIKSWKKKKNTHHCFWLRRQVTSVYQAFSHGFSVINQQLLPLIHKGWRDCNGLNESFERDHQKAAQAARS